ncbi:MAG: adenosine-specific kinase [Candidatus Bathyarchaeia archaeon]
MGEKIELKAVTIKPPEGIQLILGQSHFIKTVEDLYEALITSSPSIKFGVAFCESSGPALVRFDGNDEELIKVAVECACNVAAGHFFVVTLKDCYPINVLNRIKMVDEVANVFCATGNPVEVILAETDQGRGVLGVIDGISSKGVENYKEKEKRLKFLRDIGYKR